MTHSINPYQVPAAADPSTTVTPARDILILIAWFVSYFYPIIAVGSVYLSWFTAWLLIGHQPRPMVDDPQQIGGLMNAVYPVAFLLISFWPPLALCGLFITWRCPIPSIRQRYVSLAALFVSYIAICAIAAGFIHLDPGRVFEWFAD